MSTWGCRSSLLLVLKIGVVIRCKPRCCNSRSSIWITSDIPASQQINLLPDTRARRCLRNPIKIAGSAFCQRISQQESSSKWSRRPAYADLNIYEYSACVLKLQSISESQTFAQLTIQFESRIYSVSFTKYRFFDFYFTFILQLCN